MLITKAEAARQLDISKATIGKWEKKIPRPGYFIEYDNKIQIETDHPEWKARRQKTLDSKNKTSSRNISQGQTQKHAIKKYIKQAVQPEQVTPEEAEQIEQDFSRDKTDPPPQDRESNNPEMDDLIRRSAIASLQDTIYQAKIKEEKSKQEEIKTAEIKKDLGPIDLMKYYFSTIEGLSKDCYRRMHEVDPKLSALYLGGENKKAVRLLQDELESIFVASVKTLIDEIKHDGYSNKVVQWNKEKNTVT